MDLYYDGNAESNQSASILNYLRDSSDKHYNKVASLFDKVGVFNGPHKKKGFSGVAFLLPSAEGLKEIESQVKPDLCEAQRMLRAHILNEDLGSAEKFKEKMNDIPDENRKKLKVLSVKGEKVELEGATATLDTDFHPICGREMSIWILDGKLSKGEEDSGIKPVRKKGSSEPASNTYDLRKDIYDKLFSSYLVWMSGDARIDTNPFLKMYASLIEFVDENGGAYRNDGVDQLTLLQITRTYSPEANMLILLEPGRKNLCNPILLDCVLKDWWIKTKEGTIVNHPRTVMLEFSQRLCKGDCIECNGDKLVELDNKKSKISKDFMESFRVNNEKELETMYNVFQKHNIIAEIEHVEPQKEHDYLYCGRSKSETSSLCYRKAWFDQIIFDVYTCLPRLEKHYRDSSSKTEKMSVLGEMKSFFEKQCLCNAKPYSSSRMLNSKLWSSSGILNVPMYYDLVYSLVKNRLLLYIPVTPSIVTECRKSIGNSQSPIDKKLENLDDNMLQRLRNMPDPEFMLSKQALYEVNYKQKRSGH